MKISKRFFLGVGVSYFYIFSNFFSSVLITRIIIQSLGDTPYGVWAIFNSLITYLILLDFGFNISIAKYTAQYGVDGQFKKLNTLVSTTFFMTGFICLAVLAVSWIFAPVILSFFNIPPELLETAETGLPITVLNVSVLLIAGVFGNVLYGMKRIDLWKGFGVLQYLVLIGASYFLITKYKTLESALIASLVSSSVLLVCYAAYVLLKTQVRVSWKLFSIRDIKESIPYSIRTFILGICSRIMYYTGVLIIAKFISVSAVASYEIAYKMCFYATTVFSVISTSLFPNFAEMYQKNDLKNISLLFVRISRLSLIIMCPLILILWFQGESLINLWVGGNRFVGATVLGLFLMMNVFHAIGTPSALLLQSIGKNSALMTFEIVNAGLNLVLSILLVYYGWGVAGVILGTIIAHVATVFWVMPLQIRAHVGLNFYSYVFEGVLPPIFVGLVLWGLLAGLRHFVAFQSFTILFTLFESLVIGFSYLVLYFFIAAKTEEKVLAKNLIRKLWGV